MTTLREKTVITGIGETQYTKGSGESDIALAMEASLAAIKDAGLTPDDIDGIIPCATVGSIAEDFITNFGIADLRYSAATPMGGASRVAALQTAAMAITAGVAHHVLTPIGRNGYSGGRIGSRLGQMPQFRTVAEFEMPTGANARPSSMRPWRAATWNCTARRAHSSLKSR
jgi:acetyl-CoA acetyltransferase